MRLALRLAGNLLIGLSVLGLLGLGALVLLPAPSDGPAAGVTAMGQAVLAPWAEVPPNGRLGSANHAHLDGQPGALGVAANNTAVAPAAEVPITHLAIPSIDLDVDVVDAALVDVDGGFTWQVPAFKVGHAESTAGAGQAGNAVLLGHVTSLHSGNVFADLDRVRVGDTIQVFSDDRQFDYTVVSAQPVPRTDSSVLQPTSDPSVSLITCTGVWLPTIWDYTERLVVHAELAQ
jgi:LPXTG-site transpeptidase (sortase) family protein